MIFQKISIWNDILASTSPHSVVLPRQVPVWYYPSAARHFYHITTERKDKNTNLRKCFHFQFSTILLNLTVLIIQTLSLIYRSVWSSGWQTDRNGQCRRTSYLDLWKIDFGLIDRDRMDKVKRLQYRQNIWHVPALTQYLRERCRCLRLPCERVIISSEVRSHPTHRERWVLLVRIQLCVNET